MKGSKGIKYSTNAKYDYSANVTLTLPTGMCWGNILAGAKHIENVECDTRAQHGHGKNPHMIVRKPESEL